MSLSSFRVILLLTAISMSITAHADSQKTFVVGVHDWPPYASPDSKYLGLLPRMTTEILQQQGIHISYRFIPWQDALDGVMTETVDGALVWLPEDIKREPYLVSDPILQPKAMLCQRKQMPAITSKIRLKGYRMGMNPHYVYDAGSYKMLRDKFMVPVKQESDMGNFRLLLNGNIDFFLTPDLSGKPLLLNQFSPDEQNALTCPVRFFTFPPAHLIINKHRKGSAEFIKQFNAGLKRLQSNGMMDRYLNDFRHDRY